MIPLVNPALAQTRSTAGQPWLSGPLRWIVVVLALVATFDAAYLTWSSFTTGVVAGCDGSGLVDCDAVLASRWSRVVGLPVALGGLACYGAILVLGLMAGSRGFNEYRRPGTALAAIALLAAGSGIWFTLLQIFAVGSICYYCLGIHACGLTIAGLVLWSAQGSVQRQTSASQSHVAMSAALPGARRKPGPRPAEGPSLLAAWPVAGVLLAAFITAQVLFPTKTFQASTPELAETIDMTADVATPDADELSPTAQEHVVNRVADDPPAEPPLSAEPLVNEPADADTDADVDATPEVEFLGEASDDSGEIGYPQPASKDDPPALKRDVEVLNNRVKFDIYNEAVLGSPDAEFVVVELMDYTCPHCRKMHGHIREALDRYGDQLAVVIMPVPLELECNKRMTSTDPIHRGACKMSKLALAVSSISPAKFVDFHNFLMADEEKPPSTVQAVERAFRLVGTDRLREAGKDPAIEARIQKYIQLFNALGAENRSKKKSFGLPVQIVGDTVLSGGDVTSEEMFAAWEKALGIKPL